MTAPPDQARWPALARDVLEHAVRKTAAPQLPLSETPQREYGGVFVTLHKLGRLRGCMGTLDNSRPLTEAVRYAAASAALHDPRFPPVTVGELPELVVEVSILSAPWPMRDLDDLELGRHGVLVRDGLNVGLFLPQVAIEHHLDKETFLSRCCSEKAGLEPHTWRAPQANVMLFTTQVFSEAPPPESA